MNFRVALGALAAAALLASPAYAESPRVGQLVQAQTGTFETTISTSAPNYEVVSGIGPGAIVYGFSVYTTAANGNCALYDGDAVTDIANTQGVFIDEGGSATALAPYQSLWPAPYRIVSGLVVSCVSARAIIYHDVKI